MADLASRRHVAVVGAGLGGLTAAYRLSSAGWRVTVFEAGPEVGGRVRTVERDGYLADVGATAIGAGYPEYHALAAELGLRVIPGSPIIGVYRDGRVRHLDVTRIGRSRLDGLISPAAALRAARLVADVGLAKVRGLLDRHDMGKAAPLDTESVREYALRALGSELESYVCGPIARIMELADSDKVSKAVLFTAVAGILKGRLCALEGGQQRLADALAERVPVQLGHPVERVGERTDAVEIDYRDPDGEARTVTVDAAVVACDLPAALDICPEHDHILRPLADHVRYNQTFVVSIGTTRPPDSPAYVVQMPTCEDREIAAIFLHHNKAADRQPPGHGLLGIMWEQDAALAWARRGDEEIVERTMRTVRRVFPELRDKVDFTHVHRWARALPLHDVGSFKRVSEFTAGLGASPRVRFTGDYRAIDGQNSAVELGAREAERLDRTIRLSPGRIPS